MMIPMYDLIIIGAGPAGLTAALYASCYRLTCLVIGQILGGQLTLATHLLNYPGFISITGEELVDRLLNQIKANQVKLLQDEVVKIDWQEKKFFNLTTKNQQNFSAQALILATGTERRKLNVPGELAYTGKGVYYCAICEPVIYQNKEVVVVGGGDSAFQAALKLAEKSQSVTILIRSQRIVAQPVLVEQVQKHPKIKILFNTAVKEIKGDDKVKEIMIVENGQLKQIKTQAVFIEIGGVPGTALTAPLGIKLTQKGFIEVDNKMQTSIPGIFAAGDIVGHELSLEQLATAIGLGARAAASAYFYLKGQGAPIVWGEAKIQRRR